MTNSDGRYGTALNKKFRPNLINDNPIYSKTLEYFTETKCVYCIAS